MKEIWKPVVGFEDLYEVSDLGRVRSHHREVPSRGGRRIHRGKMLRPQKHSAKSVYLSVGLSNGEYRTQQLIHRLVLTAFRGPCPPGKEVRHDNGVGSDNRLDNLFWSTHEENVRDQIRHNTRCYGGRNGAAKINKEDVLRIRRYVEQGRTQVDVASEFGICQQQVSRIISGARWSHV